MRKAEVVDKTHPEYEALVWLQKALNKEDETMVELRHVHIVHGIAAASDGHRLHQYELSELMIEDGAYELHKSNGVMIMLRAELPDMKRPKFEDAFPKGDPVKVIEDMGPVSKKGIGIAADFTKIVRRMTEDETINLEYVKDMLSMGPWKVNFYAEAHSAVFFQGQNRQGLLMPLRI